MVQEAEKPKALEESVQPEAKRPAAKAAKPSAPEDINKLRSVLQRQAAAAERRAADAESRLAAISGERENLLEELKVRRQAGEHSEEMEEQIKWLAKERQAVIKVRQDSDQRSKEALIINLSAIYGVPEKTLQGFDDPRDMKIAALEYAASHRKDTSEEEGEEEEEKPPAPAYDQGAGGLSSNSIKDMTPAEFAKLTAGYEAQARKDALSRR